MSTELASSRHERVGLREGDEIENCWMIQLEIIVVSVKYIGRLMLRRAMYKNRAFFIIYYDLFSVRKSLRDYLQS